MPVLLGGVVLIAVGMIVFIWSRRGSRNTPPTREDVTRHRDQPGPR